MNILITGNLGYVGSVAVPFLKREVGACNLIGLDVGFFGSSSHPLCPPAERFLSHQIYRDIRDIDLADLQGIDAVIHLAAISNDPMGKQFEQATEAINLNASMRLYEWAARSGVKRFIFASSCSMYGSAEGSERTEESELSPLTAYARSKVAFERFLGSNVTPGLTVTALRFATACGFSPRLRLDLVLNDFVAAAVRTGVIRVQSDGTPWRPLIDVEDMARALAWGLLRDPAELGPHVSYNAGALGCNYQIIDLANAVAAKVSGARVEVNPMGSPDLRSYRVDFHRFHQSAGRFQPQVSLSQSIDRLIEGISSWDRANQQQDYYFRLKTLNHWQQSGSLDASISWKRD